MKTGGLTGAGRKSAADGEQIKLNGESLGGKKKKKETRWRRVGLRVRWV